ncbi:7 transmembrane receptor [Dictyocaulus viviparus]|uniref:7 transmembrane receptor n=1 Tax=Dictyocaulus viviparus TaxID=29172 RepID=A0A0D8XJS0_DICVI|nr:7 transmembrane receptor [Dictyocaulus viviparus]
MLIPISGISLRFLLLKVVLRMISQSLQLHQVVGVQFRPQAIPLVPPHARAAVVMERALPSLANTILPLVHDSWPEDDNPIYSSTKETTATSLVLTKTMLVVFVVAMIIVTIVGNALVCLAVLLVRKLKQPANFLIVSLAIADFFVGLLVMPLALVDLLFSEWPLGRSMCKMWTTADLTLCTASIVSLCAISVDRYLVVTRPLKYSAVRTTGRMLVYIVIIWVIAAVVSLSSHIITNLLDTEQVENRICQVIQHFAYQIYATIISFYGPTIIMLILYVQIWRAAKRITREDKDQTKHIRIDIDKNINNHMDLISKTQTTTKIVKSHHRNYLHRTSALFQVVRVSLNRQNDGSECKARKTLGIIMSVFIICWLPFFSLAVLKSCLQLKVPYWLDVVTLWLGYSNSTLNPAIYCKYNNDFRVPFREMLACRCSTLQNEMRRQSFTSRYGPTVVMNCGYILCCKFCPVNEVNWSSQGFEFTQKIITEYIKLCSDHNNKIYWCTFM